MGLWGFTAFALLFWGALATLRQPPHRRRTQFVRRLQSGDLQATLQDLAASSPDRFPRSWEPATALARKGHTSRMLEALWITSDMPDTSWARTSFFRRFTGLIPVWLDSREIWLADDRMSEAELHDLSRLRDLLHRLPDGADRLQCYRKYLETLCEYTRERDPLRHAILEDLHALALKGDERETTGKHDTAQP
jgi:hypothetical protein